MKLSKKIILLLVVALLLVFVLVLVYAQGNAPSSQTISSDDSAPAVVAEPEPEELALPAIVTDESRYEVLTIVGEGEYRAKDVSTGAEVDLGMPSDATVSGGEITVGSILRVNKSSVLGNGVLVFDVSVE